MVLAGGEGGQPRGGARAAGAGSQCACHVGRVGRVLREGVRGAAGEGTAAREHGHARARAPVRRGLPSAVAHTHPLCACSRVLKQARAWPGRATRSSARTARTRALNSSARSPTLLSLGTPDRVGAESKGRGEAERGKEQEAELKGVQERFERFKEEATRSRELAETALADQ
eukprot:872963-Rhodomonas_salina.1